MFSLLSLRIKRLLARVFYRQGLDKRLLSLWVANVFKTNKQFNDMEFLVVDLETSALSSKHGEILSIGWCVISESRIQLSQTEYYTVMSNGSVGQSAVFHQLRDCDLKAGEELGVILERFLNVAVGRVLVFHGASLDMEFLNSASMAFFHGPLLLPVIDTLQLEKKKLDQRNISLGNDNLRLANCRNRYNLPSYPAHNALNDAVATAELLLAQSRYIGVKAKLSDFLF